MWVIPGGVPVLIFTMVLYEWCYVNPRRHLFNTDGFFSLPVSWILPVIFFAGFFVV